MTKLRELYLRRNNIVASLDQLEYLQSLTSLRTLSLAENPISSAHGGLPHYRVCVLHFVPWLEKLDDVPVTPDEVTRATSLNLEQVIQLVDTSERQKSHVQTTFMPSESQQYVPITKHTQ